MEKRPREPEKEAETQPIKKIKTPARNPAASCQEGSGVSSTQRGALGLLQQFQKGAASQVGQKKEGVQANLKALLGSLIPTPSTSTQEQQTPKSKQVQEQRGGKQKELVLRATEEVEEQEEELEARLRSSRATINTLTLQVEHLYKKAKEGAGERFKKEKEAAEGKVHEQEQQVKQTQEQLMQAEKQIKGLEEEKRKWAKRKKKLKKEVSRAKE
eukprot:c36632_g1_i1 orf=122-763(+)